MSDQSTSGTERFVVVGCGSAKRDRELVPGQLRVKRYPAKDLYTSTYFGKKREYAEEVGDQWMILSALHGLVPPGEPIKPYDVSIGDFDDGRLDNLAHRVGMTLIEWVEWERGKGNEAEEIVILAGRKYLDPLRERDAFRAGLDVSLSYPLQQNDLGGIGEQMAWLDERVEAGEVEQKRLVPDGGVEKEQPKPEQPVSRDLDYVREHDSLLGLPLLCWECGGEADSSGHKMVLLAGGRPVCRECSGVADEIASTSLHCGYPNNNLGLDLDEATRWYKIEDRLDLNEIGTQDTGTDRSGGER